MKRITPFLWFDTQAEEAVAFYCSVFENAKVTGTMPGGPGGKPLTVSFELDGQEFVALNGGPKFKFTEATSFVIHCEDQKEIDYYWDRLLEDGGKPVACGWLKDRFGLSWQVAPANFAKLYSNPKSAPKVMQVMMKMVKLDMRKLEEAAK